MPIFNIPVFWQMADLLEIEADSLGNAVSIAMNGDTLPDGSYVADSFHVDMEALADCNQEGQGSPPEA